MSMPAYQEIDLTHCDKEPIHIPGSIQPHGVLLALREPDLIVSQVSANAEEFLGVPLEQLLGSPLQQLFAPHAFAHVTKSLHSEHPEENNPLPLTVGSRRFDGILHRYQGVTLLELEPQEEGAEDEGLLARSLLLAVARLQAAPSVREICETAAREVRRLTGFDRVMLYRFDDEENGEVVAEDTLEGLEPYLGFHYPASDIPRQARELYLLNWIRIIPDREYNPVALVPVLRPGSQQPLDLSLSVLRSVSPVHLEYMRNMGVRASMSISLVQSGRLWGLISCGHQTPRYLSYEIRSVCELLGRITAQQIAAREELEALEVRRKQRVLQERLVEAMRREQEAVLGGLLQHPAELMELVGARGVVVSSESRRWTAGMVPPLAFVERLIGWLREQAHPGVFQTKALPHLFPAAEPVREVASGLLAISTPKPVPDHVLWFRPEVIQTVNWGGNPAKPVEVEGQGPRLHPRRSFELWKEVVRSSSLPWSASEIEAAADLRRYAIEVDLGQQVVRKQKAVDARDDLVAVVSHDLKNPLAAIQVYSGLILRTANPEQRGAWQRVRSSVERIQRSAERMNTLIQDLLDLAKIEAGRFTVSARPEAIDSLMEECLEILRPLAGQKHIRMTHRINAPRLLVSADRERIFHVFSNLLGNAIKFTPEQGAIHVSADAEGEWVRFAVSDTGPGIPADQLGQVFNRFWQEKKQERRGTGLGLYIVKGIVEAHGGRVWVESQEGLGSTFFFTLPALPSPEAGSGRGEHAGERLGQ